MARLPTRLLLALAALASLSLAAGGSGEARAAGATYGSPMRPDLRIVAASLVAGTEEVRGSFAVRNDGEAMARGATVSILLDRSGVLREVKRYRLRPLDAGAERRVAVAAAASGVTAGSRLRVCADWPGTLRESREADNCRAAPVPEVSPAGAYRAAGALSA